MGGPRRYRDDVAPVVDVALPVAVLSGCEDSSERRDPDGVVAARGQCDRVLPSADLARSRCALSCGNVACVAPEADGVKVSGRDVSEVALIINGALSSSVATRGQCCPVRSESD